MAKLAPPPPTNQTVDSRQFRDWFYSIFQFINQQSGTLGTMAYQNANSVAITGGSIGGVGITGSNINSTPIGATVPSTGAFTNLSSNGTVSGTGFTNYFASPPALGSTTPNRVNTNALKTVGLTGYLYGHDNTGDVTASTTVPYTDLGRFPYGQFYSTAGQTAAAIDTVYTVTIDTQDGHNLMSLASNAVTVTNAGVYNIQFSFQFVNTSTTIGNVAFWPVVNGTDIPWSATSLAVTAKHGSSNGYISGAANVMVKLNAGDVVTMRWVTDNTACSIFANSTPPPFTAPFIPGIILTLQFISSS